MSTSSSLFLHVYTGNIYIYVHTQRAQSLIDQSSDAEHGRERRHKCIGSGRASSSDSVSMRHHNILQGHQHRAAMQVCHLSRRLRRCAPLAAVMRVLRHRIALSVSRHCYPCLPLFPHTHPDSPSSSAQRACPVGPMHQARLLVERVKSTQEDTCVAPSPRAGPICSASSVPNPLPRSQAPLPFPPLRSWLLSPPRALQQRSLGRLSAQYCRPQEKQTLKREYLLF